MSSRAIALSGAMLAGVAGAQSYLTPAYVQSTHNQCPAQSCSASYTHPVAQGNLLLAAIYAASGTVDQIGDTLVNRGWTRAALQPRAGPSTSELWFTDGGTAAGADTLTVHISMNPSPAFLEIHLYEYSGVTLGGPDCTTSTDTTEMVADSGPCTTHVPTELLFGMVNPHPNVLSAGTGFILREGTNGDWDEDQVVTSLGTYDATFNMDSSADVATLLATFAAQPIGGGDGGSLQSLEGWPVGCGTAPASELPLVALLPVLWAVRRNGRQRMPCRQSNR
jgi:hypothetical protein